MMLHCTIEKFFNIKLFEIEANEELLFPTIVSYRKAFA